MNTKIFIILIITIINIQKTTQLLNCTEIQNKLQQLRAASSRVKNLFKTIKDLSKHDKKTNSVINKKALEDDLKIFDENTIDNSLNEHKCDKIKSSGLALYNNLKNWGDLRYKTDEADLKKNNRETIYNNCLDTARYFEFLNGESSGNNQRKKKGKKSKLNKEMVQNYIKNQNRNQKFVERKEKPAVVEVQNSKIVVDDVVNEVKQVKNVRRRIFVVEKVACKKCLEDEYLKNVFNL